MIIPVFYDQGLYRIFRFKISLIRCWKPTNSAD